MKSLNPAVVLVVLGVIAVAGVVFLAVRVIQAKKTGSPASLGAMGGHVSSLLSNPLVQRFVSHAVSTAHATHHAAMDAAIVKLVPAAAPFVPAINVVADQMEAKIVNSPAPVPPAPGDPSTRPIIDFLEAHLAQLKGSPKPSS